ncbi:hypothetical protein AQUCO_06500026v1 [Aquilegia coerulea]|uniref:Uncharacterized protein n=1 Tax=Aquilegia coerulea TaxID=218851 RepID=A0A2G5CC81_AQUCA|nr:hypothetical protein AQUCO_06500026v1 [Aquilegia coerulea]
MVFSPELLRLLLLLQLHNKAADDLDENNVDGKFRPIRIPVLKYFFEEEIGEINEKCLCVEDKRILPAIVTDFFLLLLLLLSLCLSLGE